MGIQIKNINGIFMSFAVAIVAALCVGGLKADNDAITIAGICLGILLIVVIGIKEPAPAIFPILLNMFKPVKKALKPIRNIETIVPADVSSSPLN